MAKRQTAIVYITQNLKMAGDTFMRDWSALSEKDKTDLKRYAEDEQDALGIAKE